MQGNLDGVLDREEERAQQQEATARELEQTRSHLSAMETEVSSAAEFVQVCVLLW